MKDKIKNIAEKLEHQIRMHELDLNDRIKDIPQIILLLEQGFSELKEIVSFYKFKSEMDEIFFFKIIKPKFEELSEDRDELLESDPFRKEAIPLYQVITNYLKENDVTFVNI